MGRFWHPFADMRAVDGNELVLESGDGCWITDDEGRRYLDATAGLWYCNVGYGREELADAAATQLRKLCAYHTYDVLTNRPASELAERLSDLVPIADAAVFFTQCGSDAVDTAAKLARRYWQATGEPRRRYIVVRENAYHGMNAYGTSLSGIRPNGDGYGGLIEEVVVVPRDDPDAVGRVFGELSGEVAAFIGEPLIGAGGVYPPGDGYWAQVERLCRASGVLLIADEVVSGFGRLGRWFGAERYGFEPDIVVGAKGVTSGYIPLGFVACNARVREPFWTGDAGMWRHGYTYSGHAAACAVALANLDIIAREGLVQRAEQLESVLASVLTPLLGHPVVGDVRGEGLAAAVDLDGGLLAEDAGAMTRLTADLRERGLLTRAIMGSAIQISPPLVISEEEIQLMGTTIEESLHSAVAQHA